MIRTKHLFVTLLGVILAILIVGISPNSETQKASVPVEEAFFVSPREAYSVARSVGNEWSLKRSAFISKVRSALLRELREREEEEEVVEEIEKEVIEVKTPEVVPNLNYGDSVVLPTASTTVITSTSSDTMTPDSGDSVQSAQE